MVFLFYRAAKMIPRRVVIDANVRGRCRKRCPVATHGRIATGAPLIERAGQRVVADSRTIT